MTPHQRYRRQQRKVLKLLTIGNPIIVLFLYSRYYPLAHVDRGVASLDTWRPCMLQPGNLSEAISFSPMRRGMKRLCSGLLMLISPRVDYQSRQLWLLASHCFRVPDGTRTRLDEKTWNRRFHLRWKANLHAEEI
jgi:hypothetical protein